MQEDNMSQYNLSLNTTFQPFTYEEMLKPVLLATQEHRVIEEGLATLEEEAAIWDKLANSAVDQDTYQVYKNFSDEVEAEAAQLAQYGLDPQSRRRMLKMKSKYKEDIAPIEVAWKAREAEAKLQQDAYTKDNTVRFEQGAYDTPLSQYMTNPTRMTNHVSGTQVYNDVLNASKLIAQQLSDYKTNGDLDDYNKKVLADYGIDANQVQTIINKYKNNPQGLYTDTTFNSIMGSLVEGAINRSGINQWKNKDSQYYKDTYNMLFENGLKGLYGLIGKDVPSHIDNQEAIANLKASYSAPTSPRSTSGVNFGIDVLYSRKERSDLQNQSLDYKRFLVQDPKTKEWTISEKGLKEYYTNTYNNQNPITTVGAIAPGVQTSFTQDSSFKSYIYKIADQLGYSKEQVDDIYNSKGGKGLASIMQEFANIDKQAFDPTDATKIYKYIGLIDSSKLKEYTQNIAMNSSDTYDIVDWDNKQKKYVSTDEKLTKDQLLKAKAGQIEYSRYGDILTLILDDENNTKVSIKVPGSGRMNVSNDINANHTMADSIQDFIKNGQNFTDHQIKVIASLSNNSVESITQEIEYFKQGDPQAIQFFNSLYQNFRRGAMTNHYQLFGATNVKDAEIKTETY